MNACKAIGQPDVQQAPPESESGSESTNEDELEEDFDELIPGESCFRHLPLSKERPWGDLTDPVGRTALHYAAHGGHMETCKLLVDHPLSRADPMAKDGVLGWNAFHHAAAQVGNVNFLWRY